MAISITAMDNYIPISSVYPNGDIKDDDGTGMVGTSLNRTNLADIFQFFQRLCQNNGITENNLPDNATNTFQFMQAFNNAIVGVMSSLAANYQNANNIYDAIVLNGCVITITGGTTYNITSGYLFYNGYFVKVKASSITLIGGTSAYLNIDYSTYDNFPTGTLTYLTTGTADNANAVRTTHIINSTPYAIPSGSYYGHYIPDTGGQNIIVKRTGTTVKVGKHKFYKIK